MSDNWDHSGAGDMAPPANEPPASDGPTAGELLRQAREAAGLHVAALAVSLKVPVRKLEALEENRWETLSDAVFVRALAASVCRSLKIDAQPVLDRLPQTAVPRLVHDGEGINTPFRAPGDAAAPSWVSQLTKPVFLSVFALLLGALVLILLPSTQRDASSAIAADPEPKSAPPAAAAPAVVMPAPPAPAPMEAGDASSTQAAAAQTQALPAPPPPPGNPASASAAAPAPESVALPTAAAGAAPVSSGGILVFRAKGSSWVEVLDAKGAVVLRKLLAAGETMGASGALPLQVTVGRADTTEVLVRGKPFDLKPVARDNVAHFELK